METYTALRHFADSWALLGMFLAFCAVVWWVFRPGAARAQHEAAMQIFRNEDAPMAEAPPRKTEPPRRAPTTPRPDSMN
jgi:cytochrome c oxidase cbb3-type subunit 4